MNASILIARLAGPVLLAGGIGLFLSQSAYRAMAEELMRSRALMILSGLMLTPAGLAIVVTHNIWSADWRVAVTLLGWLMTLGGAVRLVCPALAERKGRAILDSPYPLKIGGAIWLIFGVILTFFGYFR